MIYGGRLPLGRHFVAGAPWGVVVLIGFRSDREVRGPGGQILDHPEQMADRARQTAEADDDQGIAGGDFPVEPGEGRAGA